MKIDNCERSGKRGRARGPKDRECSKEHWGTLLVSQTYSDVSSLWVLVRRPLSVVWKWMHNLMGWDVHDLNRCEFWFQSCSVALVTGARMQCTVHTGNSLGIGIIEKYVGRYWMFNSLHYIQCMHAGPETCSLEAVSLPVAESCEFSSGDSWAGSCESSWKPWVLLC
jgi:hypothetical protein